MEFEALIDECAGRSPAAAGGDADNLGRKRSIASTLMLLGRELVFVPIEERARMTRRFSAELPGLPFGFVGRDVLCKFLISIMSSLEPDDRLAAWQAGFRAVEHLEHPDWVKVNLLRYFLIINSSTLGECLADVPQALPSNAEVIGLFLQVAERLESSYLGLAMLFISAQIARCPIREEACMDTLVNLYGKVFEIMSTLPPYIRRKTFDAFTNRLRKASTACHGPTDEAELVSRACRRFPTADTLRLLHEFGSRVDQAGQGCAG